MEGADKGMAQLSGLMLVCCVIFFTRELLGRLSQHYGAFDAD